MSPVVVVGDVSPVVGTGDVDRIRYRGSGVVGVPKTQHSVLFVCGVGNVHRESQVVQAVHTFIERTIDSNIHDVYQKKEEEDIYPPP